MDVISIKALKISTIIGVHPHEKLVPQRLIVHIDLPVDATLPAQNDDLEKALDYDKVCQRIRDFAQNHTFELIETFAERLAQELLGNFNILWIKLRVEKKAIPDAELVSISIERHKA